MLPHTNNIYKNIRGFIGCHMTNRVANPGGSPVKKNLIHIYLK